MEYLFSYGSNNPDQLATRLKKDKIDVVIPAYYPNYKLAFGSWSKNWLGGVATMIPVQFSSFNNSNNDTLNSINNTLKNNNIIKQSDNKTKTKTKTIKKSNTKTNSKTKKSNSKIVKTDQSNLLEGLSVHENTFGYLTLLSKDDFTKLDVFEAVKYGKYSREKIEVITHTGEKIIAHTYFITPKSIAWVGPPSQLYLESIFKTQSLFWKSKFLVIPIVRADENEIVDEWTPNIYQLNTSLAKIIKKIIPDKPSQLITLAKLAILGLNNLNNFKKKFDKINKKLLINVNLEIILKGYLPIKNNIQLIKAIESKLS